MAKNPFKGMKAANKAQRQALNADRRADFKMTQSGLSAITNNMLTTQGSLGRQLSRTNARGLAAMGRIASRGNARLNRQVSHGQDQAARMFGSVVASNPNLWKGAERVAKSTVKTSRGAMKAGELQMRGANEGLDILKQASVAAAASGQYELGQALMYRAKDDAEVIAAANADLAAQRLQYKLDMKKAEQDAEYNERYLRLQMKLSGSGGSGGKGAPSEYAIQAGDSITSYMSTPITPATDTTAAVMPTADQVDDYVASLALQYGLNDREQLSLYNQVDARFGREYRSAADLGLAPTVKKGKDGKDVVEETPAAKAAAAKPIPYGEDPAKPWEKSLSDKQKDTVPVPIQNLYVELSGGEDGNAEAITAMDPQDLQEQVQVTLGLTSEDGKFAKDGKAITEDQFNGYVSYGLALLAIRVGIGGSQGETYGPIGTGG